jgi:hypothetical protein
MSAPCAKMLMARPIRAAKNMCRAFQAYLISLARQEKTGGFATGILFANHINARYGNASREGTAMAPPILELKTPWPLVNVEEENCELVVSFHAEAFLWPAVEELGKTLLSLVDETDGGQFVLDLGNVESFSGVGLEKLVLLNKKLAAYGRRLVIKNAAPKVLKAFSARGLIGVLPCARPEEGRLTLTVQVSNRCTGG